MLSHFLTLFYLTKMPCSTTCMERGSIVDVFFFTVVGGVPNSFLLVHDTAGEPIGGKHTS